MFIKKSFADEIAAAMERNLIDSNINKLAHTENQILKAADYLNAAAEIFDETGLTKQAEVITLLLETLAAKKTKKKTKAKPKSKSKAKAAPKKKSKTPIPKAKLKNPTSEEMVKNLEEKGWVFNETGNHEEHDADDNCAMCGDMMRDEDDEEKDEKEQELHKLMKELQSDFEDEDVDLRNPDTLSEEDIHPDYKIRNLRWEDPEYSGDFDGPSDPLYMHNISKGPKFYDE